MKSFTVILSVFLLACNSKKRDNSDNNKAAIVLNVLNSDSIKRVDSLKWLYYVLNYYGTAVFYDSANYKKIKVSPIECDIHLEGYTKKTEDSLSYFFALKKGGYLFQYIDGIVYSNGIGVFKNSFYPLTGHVKMDYQNNPDSVKLYLEEENSKFIIYLKNYEGEIGFWLKQEAKKRKIFK